MASTFYGVPPRRSRLPAVIAASMAIHVGLIVFLTQVPVGQRLAAQIMPVQLIERKKPPPPRPKRPPPPKPQLRKQARTVAPPRPQAAAPADSGGSEGFGVEPDDGGAGTLEVPVGRTLEAPSTATPSAPAPAAPEPLVLSVGDDRPVATLEREPAPIGALRAVYPEIPRLAGATGSALVEAFVDAGGLVSRAVLVISSAPAFGRSALEAVRQTRFRPALRSGVAVSRSIRIPVLYDLAGGEAIVVLVASPSVEPEVDSQEATSSFAPQQEASSSPTPQEEASPSVGGSDR